MEINFKELTLKGDRPLVFILSGAGLSAESGIPTFRDANGLWRKYDPKELASIRALERHTQDVFDFYNERIKNAEPCRPNAAHIAIANFQKEMAPFCDVIHVTQNVDNLNELAGAPRRLPNFLVQKVQKDFPKSRLLRTRTGLSGLRSDQFRNETQCCAFRRSTLRHGLDTFVSQESLRLYFRRHFRHRLSCGQFRERNESIDKNQS